MFGFQRKYRKHQAFENEVYGRAEEVEEAVKLGKSLIERKACDGNEETVQVKVLLRMSLYFKVHEVKSFTGHKAT